MESIILALALCGHPTTCDLPIVEKTVVSVHVTETHRVHRRPARRALKAVGRAIRFLRPFRGRWRR